MEPNKQPTCDERIKFHMNSRLDDLRQMLVGVQSEDAELIDEGTLDTVIKVMDREFRYSQETAADYRDDKTGELDLESFIDEIAQDDINESMYEAFSEYGLAFDYVAPNTFNDQPQGYFLYQISCGGPSEEIRFYTNPDFSVYKAEFWFLDWFDGASRDVTNNEAVKALIQQFADCESFEYAFKQTTD